jgi:hypothetical protein
VPPQILRRGSSVAPFTLFVTPVGRIRAPSWTGGGPRHIHQMATRGAGGGRLAMGCCRRANAVASASLDSYSSSSSLRPHLLPLAQSLSAAAPPPLAAIVIVLLIVRSSVPSMP